MYVTEKSDSFVHNKVRNIFQNKSYCAYDENPEIRRFTLLPGNLVISMINRITRYHQQRCNI